MAGEDPDGRREARLRARLARCEAELAAARAEASSLRAQIDEMTGTDAWRLLSFLRDRKEDWLPQGSLRQRVFRGLSRRLSRQVVRTAPPRLSFDVERLAAARERPRVLILSGCGGDSRRYRCAHLLEALALAGGRGELLGLPTPLLAHFGAALAAAVDVVILHRAELDPALEEFLDRLSVPVVFDTDDLLFDTALSIDEVPGLERMTDRGKLARQQAALRRCEAALCTTDFLRERIEAHGVPAHVLRNGFSSAMRRAAARALAVPAPPTDEIVLGYASGTPTHDRDFAQAEAALLTVLAEEPRAVLHLVGHLNPGPAFARFGARVRRLPFVHWSELPRVLRGFAINLAPLDAAQPFCRAKSELKFLEAALVGVPTVATPTGAFRAAIRDGANGLLAADADGWLRGLRRLVAEPGLRASLGEEARRDVLGRYALGPRGRRLLELCDGLGVPVAPAPR